MITGDQVLVKRINKALVLNTIRKKDVIFRAEIAKKTGLNRSTVSALVDELLADGLILETGTGVSQGGRKPVILSINKDFGSVIGIDLGVNYILSVLTNFAGDILWEKRLIVPTNVPQQQRLDDLYSLIEETLRHAPPTVRGIIGIGVGVPGIVNYQEGLILLAPNLRWKNVHLRTMIEERFHIPVCIDNEANAGAIGEKWFGMGKKASDFVYVSAGTGIGTGIIINNELYRGASGLAGEMGHMTIDAGGRPCLCGNVGCWEEHASEKALFHYLREHLDNAASSHLHIHSLDQMTALDINEAAKAGDPLASQALRHVGRQLGVGVAGLINTFNPGIVIIGNALALAGDYIMDELYHEVSRRCFTAKYFPVKIVLSALNLKACAIGAVSLVISKVYSAPVTQPSFKH